ncbi:MAG: hypothetical protein M3Q97_03825 [Bacteroidota bacterium]|nr:hypothetical protein [Bacteroidota bacterium]
MPSSYTQEDVVRFIYAEVTPEEHIAIGQAIEQDAVLYETYQEMREVLSRMDKFSASPHPSTIEIIMEHSQFLEQPSH